MYTKSLSHCEVGLFFMLIIFAFEYIQLTHKKTYPKRAGGRQKKDRIIFLERLPYQPVCLIICILMQSLLNNFNDFHIKKDLWRRFKCWYIND